MSVISFHKLNFEMVNLLKIRRRCQRQFIRSCIYVTIGILIYFLVRRKRYTESFSIVVSDTRAKGVWEYVADFSNHQRLNPAVSNFEIEYEKGNYGDWEYAVTYLESSQTFPQVTYNNRVIVRVLPKKEHGGDAGQSYRILYNSNVCIAGYCLKTNSEMRFIDVEKKSTQILEVVHFECPSFIALLCHRDLQAQKLVFYENIKKLTAFMI